MIWEVEVKCAEFLIKIRHKSSQSNPPLTTNDKKKDLMVNSFIKLRKEKKGRLQILCLLSMAVPRVMKVARRSVVSSLLSVRTSPRGAVIVVSVPQVLQRSSIFTSTPVTCRTQTWQKFPPVGHAKGRTEYQLSLCDLRNF